MDINFKKNIVANNSVGLKAGPHIVTHGPDFNTPLGYSGENYIFPESKLPKKAIRVQPLWY
jgi:hypothetical protein